MDQLESNEGLTRAKVLKRAGIGAAAAAGFTPFFASSASAAVSPVAKNVGACNDGGGNTYCDFQQCATKNGLACFCYSGGAAGGKSSGCCVCGGNQFCSQLVQCPNGNHDCPRGYKCAISTGCGMPICVPPCGVGISGIKGSASGKTLLG